MTKVPVAFGEWRPDIAVLDNDYASIAENVFADANSYVPFASLQAVTQQSLMDGGNDANTKILIPFTGADASTTFTDTNAGGSAHTWTAAGNAQIDTADFPFQSGSSGLFDGTGDWISSPDSVDFTLGSQFTVELRAKPAVNGTALNLAGQCDAGPTAANTSFTLSRTAGNRLSAIVSNGSTFTALTGSSTTFTTGTWRAIALELYNGVLTLYMDGVIEATAAFAGAVHDSANNFRVGATGEVTTTPWNGWIAQFRLSNVARYRGVAYTPATVPFFVGGPCVGMYMARTSVNNWKLYAGTANRLFTWTSLGWTDISRASGGLYSVALGDLWRFQQNGTKVVAVHLNDNPQVVDVDSGSNFADLAGNPPRARNIAQVGPFLILAGLATNERKIQWSAIENITGWTIGTNLSDEQEMPEGGPVQGIAGGEVGYVVQDRAIRTLQWLPGDTSTIFSLQRVVQDRGCISKYGFTVVSGVLYFVAEDGFYGLAGQQLIPIGQDKINDWWLNHSDPTRRNQTLAFDFQHSHRIGWAFYASANSMYYDYVITYDWALQRFTYGIVSAQIWSIAASFGLDLDTEGSEPGDFFLDSNAASLDSFAYIGGRPLVGAIDINGKLAFLTGPALQATMETAERHLVPGQRTYVSETYPLADTANAAIAAGTRERLGDPIAFDIYIPLEITGSASLLSSSRLHRFRMQIPANETWTHAQGVLAEAQADGAA